MQLVNQFITARSLVSCAVGAQASLALSPPCYLNCLARKKSFISQTQYTSTPMFFVFKRVRTAIFLVHKNRTGCLQYKIKKNLAYLLHNQ